MKIRVIAPTVLSLGAIVCAPASAQTMRPGLWEVKNTIEGQGASDMQGMAEAQKQMSAMREQMARMPPEQRKAMEAMMSRMGPMPEIDKDGGMTVKVCMTPEMAAGNQVPVQQRENCTSKRSAPVGGVMKISYVCTNPPSSGQGTVTSSSDTAYTMDMTMNLTEGGRNHTTSMSSRGKWLAASCGNVKPPVMHPPARP